MVATTSVIAACSIFALSLAAPLRNAAFRAIVARDTYIMFGGDGTMATGWPSRKQWLSWDDAWYVWFLENGVWLQNADTLQESQP